METRKVQVTGGSTYTVSIPKDWARENDVEGGSEVGMFPSDSSLVIETLDPADEDREGVMDITGLEGDHLLRAVITMYVSGFDVMKFESDRITSSQRRTLRKASQRLAGLEVIEETGDVVVFQDLLDSSQLSIHRSVSRMRLIAESMFEDSVKAVVENDDAISDDVVERDEDVDRMFAMVSRTFRSSLHDARSEEEMGVTRDTCFDYYTTARQLERVADHAAKIAEISREIDDEIDDEIGEALYEASQDSVEIVDDAVSALMDLDDDAATERANEVLDSVSEIEEEHTREIDKKIRDLDPQTAQALGLVIDSINRAADYGANIAETALESAAPKP
ncbi:PhoU domain-containing protein [Halorutilales archaeon Cl-col2-1]